MISVERQNSIFYYAVCIAVYFIVSAMGYPLIPAILIGCVAGLWSYHKLLTYEEERKA